MRTVIMADDLTGAADTAVPFAKEGLRTFVRLSPQGTSADFANEADVESWNTSTRDVPATAAFDTLATAVRNVLELAPSPEQLLIYKKIDSGIRGNVASEIDASLHALAQHARGRSAVVAPAFPEQGRTTLHGTQYIHGVPVSQTPTGMDPINPVQQSHIPSLLAERMARPVRSVPIEAVRGGSDLLRQSLTQDRGSVLVVDAETSADLDAIAEAFWGAQVLWVGSGGLARALAGKSAASNGSRAVGEEERPPAVWLTICASLHPVSRAQMAALAAYTGLEPIEIPSSPVPGVQPILARCRAQMATARQALVVSSAPAGGEARSSDRRASLVSNLRALGEALAGDLASGGYGVILVGGDTAEAILDGLGAEGLWLRGEIQPGVAVGTIRGGAAAGTVTITKAGGFGSDATLVELVQRFGWSRRS